MRSIAFDFDDDHGIGLLRVPTSVDVAEWRRRKAELEAHGLVIDKMRNFWFYLDGDCYYRVLPKSKAETFD